MLSPLFRHFIALYHFMQSVRRDCKETKMIVYYYNKENGGKCHMQSFTYHVPTKVIFGAGTEQQAGSAVKASGGSNVLVLYGGGSAVKSGLLDRVTASLSEVGLIWTAKGGVQPNPILGFVNETIEACKGNGTDFILAVGGGSVIDTAKAVAYGLAVPEVPVWDYFTGKATQKAALPIGCVLTIAAAGSETSDSCVITNEATGEKRGSNTDFNRPRFAILDPELTYTLPPYQTACGVVDIMMHTMDRYFNSAPDNELTDALSEALLRTTIQYGVEAMEHPESYQARSELMWCGSISHNNLTGLGRTKDFSVHQFGHELSGKYGIAHGGSLAIMWPAWAKAVCKTDYARFARFARNVWGVVESDDRKAALAGIAAAEKYFKSLSLPVTLGESEIGVVPPEDMEALALGCSRNRSRSVGSFCPLDHDAIRAVYEAANI